MANHTMEKSSAPHNPQAQLAHMARVMLGNSADAFGGCHEESFVKGYQKGFDAGWAFGFEQAIAEGKKEGRREAEEELKERAKKAKAETICLLSDAALSANTWDTSSINSEDVFYDSRSGDSDDESDDEGLVFYDASPDRAVSEDGSNELDEAPTPAASNADDSQVPIITLTVSEEEDLLDLFYEADQLATATPAVTSSPESASSNSIIHKPASLPATNTSCVNEAAMTDVFLSSSPEAGAAPTSPLPFTTPNIPPVHLRSPPSHLTPTPAPRNTITIHAATTPSTTTTSSSHITTTANPPWPILPPHHPRILPLLTSFPPSTGLSTLHGIPLPHTIRPATPDFTLARGPRPAYPRLAGAFNIYRAGIEVVTNPWRLLIGPLSKQAREEWKGDGGKAWIRGKLGETVGGAYGVGFRGGWGRGGGRGGWSGRGHDGIGGAGGDGVALCQMVRDADEVWYLLVLFESPERAKRAEETFRGYPCGGSIMWAWPYQEEE